MKRKRHQIEEEESHVNINNNESKKLRIDSSFEEDDVDTSFEQKKEEFVLTREVADSAVLTDIAGSKWRIGSPVGKGSFGEIFVCSNDISHKVDVKSARFVTKIEPHSNGPLFVEIHCLLNVNKRSGKNILSFRVFILNSIFLF